MNKKNMLEGNVLRTLILFAIPIFASNLFQELYNTIDIWIVGNLLGEKALAAIGASTPIYDLLVGFAFGIGNGISIAVSRYFGAGDRKMLRQSIATALIIGLFISLTLTIVGQTCINSILHFLGTPDEILDDTKAYILTIMLFCSVMIFFNLLSRILTAIGNSVMPMIFLMISSILNILLDYVFIAFFRMGVGGAAIATVIAQFISVILCLIYIKKACHDLIPQKADFRISLPMYKEMASQGLANGLMTTIVNTGTLILQFGINGLGTWIIAGHTTARRLFSFCSMTTFSMSLSMMTFISQNIGAKQYDRVKKAVFSGMLYDIVISVILAMIILPFAPRITSWLSGSKNETLIWYSSLYIRFSILFQFVLANLCNLRLALQGMGQKILPLFSSIIEFFGKILFVILFIPHFKAYALIVCEPIIWCIMTLQLLWAYRKTIRQWDIEA